MYREYYLSTLAELVISHPTLASTLDTVQEMYGELQHLQVILQVVADETARGCLKHP